MRIVPSIVNDFFYKKKLTKHIYNNMIFQLIISCISYLIFAILVIFFGFLVYNSIIFIFYFDVSLSNIFYFKSDALWRPEGNNLPLFNILPLVLGSLKVAIVAILIAFPISLSLSIYCIYFTSNLINSIIKFIINLIASIPPTVIGFLFIYFIIPISKTTLDYNYMFSAFIAGVAVSIVVIPMVYNIIYDAMKSIPISLIESSIALGASIEETIIHIVFGESFIAISSAILLGLNRALSESIIVVMLSGSATYLTLNIFEPTCTLTSTINLEFSDVAFYSKHYYSLFFLAIILICITVLINAIVVKITSYFKNRFFI